MTIRDDDLPPCVDARYRDAAMAITPPSATAVVISLGAARLRRFVESTEDEAVVVEALNLRARRRNATPRDLTRATQLALAELREGRSTAWCIRIGVLALRARPPLPLKRLPTP